MEADAADRIADALRALVGLPMHVQVRMASERVDALTEEEVDLADHAVYALGLACRGRKDAIRVARARETVAAEEAPRERKSRRKKP